MTREEVKLAIQEVIKTNHNEEITGQILQDALLKIINNAEFPEDIPIKINTTAYWNAIQGFIPENGEIIIYSDYKSITKTSPISGEEIIVPVPSVKVGTGNAYVQDLAFVDEWYRDLLLEHVADTAIHVSAQDRVKWNNKINCGDAVENENLILNRN